MNLTTLEDMSDKENPYNLGIVYNIKVFFGCFFTAFLPIKISDNFEGYYFYKKEDRSEYLSYPLKEYNWEKSPFYNGKKYSIEEFE